MKVIIWENKNGNVSVGTPAADISIEECLKHCPADAIVVDAEILPNDHNDFFDAWQLKGGVVSVNLEKAKALTKNRLRAERAPLLAAQDVAFQRALETSADLTAIVTEKNRLRDITQLADSAQSLDELRAITVEVK